MSDLSSALIGATGFVGSNLLRQRTFDATFSSRTIDEIDGRSFDLVVCAGAPAEKWKANAEPDADLGNIEHLTRALSQVNVQKLVLISTVDVFVTPLAVNEDSPTPMGGLHAYGRNRRRLEQIVAGRFDVTIVRLPALYGPGLKKNVVHDLLHDHELSKIDSRGVFQFYDVERLWSDITIALEHDLPLVHLPTEPVSVVDVASKAFGQDFVNELPGNPPRYDVHTQYAELFGGHGLYVENRAAELVGLRRFVERERGTGEQHA